MTTCIPLCSLLQCGIGQGGGPDTRSAGRAVLETLKRELERYRQRPFLDALMAGCALVATSDGVVSLSERSRVDRIFESLRELETFDANEAVDRFNDFAEAIAEDAAEGRLAALAELEDQAHEPIRATLLLRACVAVSLADGELNDAERLALADVCSALALPPDALDTAIAGFAAAGPAGAV
jgi:tellurite resistance protein TerB